MKVICINHKNKPAKISQKEWIKEGVIYTVIDVAQMGIQAGKYGYKLEEVELSSDSFPYEYYSADRFGILENQSLEATEKKEELILEEFTI